MSTRPVHAESIRRAALLLGGYARLAERVGAPAEVLEWWAAGAGDVPDAVFLAVVDVLLGEPSLPTPTRSSPEAWTRYRK